MSIFSSITDLSIPDAAPGTTIIEFIPFLSTEIAAEPVFSPFAIIKPSVLTFSFGKDLIQYQQNDHLLSLQLMILFHQL